MTRNKPLILVSLLVAAFAINLDVTIVNVALPSLVRELHASNSQLQWVVDAYSLVFAALILAAGSLSDRPASGRVLHGCDDDSDLHDHPGARARMGQRSKPRRVRPGRGPVRRVHRARAERRRADDRPRPVPEPAIHGRQRLGHRGVL